MAIPHNRQSDLVANLCSGAVWRRALLALIAVLCFGIDSGNAATRIRSDFGGRIGTYVERYDKLRTSEQNVIIDGDCFSACTIVLGMIPKSHLCLTERARFGFHSAWKPGLFGFRVDNEDGTQIMWGLYPRYIQEWITRNGGLTDRLLYLKADDLKGLYKICR